MKQVEIYWDDLTPQKQTELLEILGDDCNFDVFPICTLDIEEDDHVRSK